MHRLLLGVMTTVLISGFAAACFKKTPVPRVAEAMPVTVVWVADVEAPDSPLAAPDKLIQQSDDLLAQRNLVPVDLSPDVWREAFKSRRATPQRLTWLGERLGSGLVMLVELRPYYDNITQGRFRWIVNAQITVRPVESPENSLDARFEVPVFLQFSYMDEDDAMIEAKGEILRRLGKLIDNTLQDPDAAWKLEEPSASKGRAMPPRASERVDPREDRSLRALPLGEHGPIYFVMLDRFANGDPSNDGDVDPADPQGFHGGDLRGLLQRLDHIEQLGFRAIWMTPLSRMQRDKTGETGGFHGYWMLDPAELDPHLGTEADLLALRDEVARRGMGLVLDVVTNHVGYASPLPADRPDWFHGHGPVVDWHDPVQSVTYDVHGLPDLAVERPDVAAWLLDAATRWIDRVRPEGFRMDAVRHLDRDFLRTYNDAVAARGGPGFLQLGELFDGSPLAVAGMWREGHFRQMFDFPLHYAMVDVFCRDANPALLPALLDLDRVYPDPAGLVTFLDNHDLPRILTVCGGDEARVVDALTFQWAVRGIPSVTYGTETGMRGEEPANRADMVFGPLTTVGERLQAMAKARAAHPAVGSVHARTLLADEDGFAVLQVQDGQAVVIAQRRTRGPVPLGGTLPQVAGARDLLTGEPVQVGQGIAGGAASLFLPDDRVHVMRLDVTDGIDRLRALVDDAPPRVVRFEAHADADALVVVGAAPELGGWDPGKGVRLTRQDGVWRGEVTLPDGVAIAYKLVAFRSGQPQWEDGDNRFLHVRDDASVQVAWGTRG